MRGTNCSVKLLELLSIVRLTLASDGAARNWLCDSVFKSCQLLGNLKLFNPRLIELLFPPAKIWAQCNHGRRVILIVSKMCLKEEGSGFGCTEDGKSRLAKSLADERAKHSAISFHPSLFAITKANINIEILSY